jgi:Undecaprenyl-phosphate galactose phosphotransferase WbaP
LSAYGTAVKPASIASVRGGGAEAELKKTHRSGWANKPICALVVLLSDVFMLAVALHLAVWIRSAVLPYSGLASQNVFGFQHYMTIGWTLMLIPVFFAVEGLYTQRRTMWKEFGFLAKAIGAGLVAVLAAVALEKRSEEISRITILLLGVNLMLLMPASRFGVKWLLGTLGPWRKRLLVLGAGESARLALCGLNDDPIMGYHVVGLLDDDTKKHGLCLGTSCNSPVYVLGSLAGATDLIHRNEAQDVLIAMPDLPEINLLPLVHSLQGLAETVYVVPASEGLPMMNLQLDGFLDQQVCILKISNNLANPWNEWLKHMFDLAFAGILAVITLPVMAVIALLVRLDSHGPALLRQERIGRAEKPFACLKFRTMHLDGDERLARCFADHPHMAEEWGKYAKLRSGDPRLTRIGRVLRRWSLDELPQIFNVLSGEMSLVGPRPYLARERERIGPHFTTILTARPGMTGFWQVSGKNKVTFDDRVRLEVWYVRNWSLWFDFIILAKTFGAIVRADHS